MFFGSLQAQRWHPPHALQACHRLGPLQKEVLAADAPLMRMLRERHRLALALQIVAQWQGVVRADEAPWLRLPIGAPALRRRVRLLHGKVAMIEAEAVVPLAGLSPALAAEIRRGKQPLGELLVGFGLKTDRNRLAAAQLRRGPWRHCWARCSVLSGEGTQALVAEVFLPGLWEQLQARPKIARSGAR